MAKFYFCFGIIFIFNVQQGPAFSSEFETDRRIPNEYETLGDSSLGLSNSGVASASGVAAVRANPALLSVDKTYAVSGGYNWPVQGRDFFQAGVIDSKSSTVAAGFSYTGFMDDYQTDLSRYEKDSPVTRRAAVGFGYSFGNISGGIGGQYVEGNDLNDIYNTNRIKGTSLSMGAAGYLTPMIRGGVSVENLANSKVRDFAPKTLRAGIALEIASGNIVGSFDLRQRDRVSQLESGSTSFFADGLTIAQREEISEEDGKFRDPERMAFLGLSARVYDMVRLLGSYGQNVDGPERQSLSGGVAVISNNFSLSFCASRPYLKATEAQQAVNASFAISL